MATKSKYTKYIRGNPVDVYDVLQAWNVTCPALQHLLKKALQAGNRGNKTLREDLQDIVDSAIRAQELNDDLDREYDEAIELLRKSETDPPELFYRGTDKLCNGSNQQRKNCANGLACACWARDQKEREEKAIAKKSMYNQTQL